MSELTKCDCELAALKAKLVMVAKWRDRWARLKYNCSSGNDKKGQMHRELCDILADTTPPLAVVEGEISTNGADVFIDAELPGYMFDWRAEKYTIIVLAKEDS